MAMAAARAAAAGPGVPLAAPSANTSGRPSPTSAQHVLDDLAGRVPAVVDGGGCGFGVESTVLDALRAPPVVLRPGGVTAEDLAAAPEMAGLQVYARDFRDSALEAAPTTPGMKYRHYSPSAPPGNSSSSGQQQQQQQQQDGLHQQTHQQGRALLQQLVADATQELLRRVQQGQLQELAAAGPGSVAQRVVLLSTSGVEVLEYVLGSWQQPELVAQQLFAALRAADQAGADLILVQGLPPVGTGQDDMASITGVVVDLPIDSTEASGNDSVVPGNNVGGGSTIPGIDQMPSMVDPTDGDPEDVDLVPSNNTGGSNACPDGSAPVNCLFDPWCNAKCVTIPNVDEDNSPVVYPAPGETTGPNLPTEAEQCPADKPLLDCDFNPCDGVMCLDGQVLYRRAKARLLLQQYAAAAADAQAAVTAAQQAADTSSAGDALQLLGTIRAAESAAAALSKAPGRHAASQLQQLQLGSGLADPAATEADLQQQQQQQQQQHCQQQHCQQPPSGPNLRQLNSLLEHHAWQAAQLAHYCSLGCRSADSSCPAGHQPGGLECGRPWPRLLPEHARLASRCLAAAAAAAGCGSSGEQQQQHQQHQQSELVSQQQVQRLKVQLLGSLQQSWWSGDASSFKQPLGCSSEAGQGSASSSSSSDKEQLLEALLLSHLMSDIQQAATASSQHNSSSGGGGGSSNNTAWSSVEAMLKSLGQLVLNGIAVRPLLASSGTGDASGRQGLGLFAATALLNHSCDPNCSIRFEGRQLLLVCVRGAAAGQELTISYGPQLGQQPTQLRQQQLLQQYGFVCRCRSCRMGLGLAATQQQPQQIQQQALLQLQAAAAAVDEAAGIMSQCEAVAQTQQQQQQQQQRYLQGSVLAAASNLPADALGIAAEQLMAAAATAALLDGIGRCSQRDAAAADKPAAAAHLTNKRAKDEIDEIFGKSSKKAPSAAAANAEDNEEAAAEAAADPQELQQLAKQVEEARRQAKRPKVEGSKDDIFGESTGKARKRTDEGYAIYGEDELGLGKKGGGDTPLCPFDCDCCY
ncbi:hypothetical protein COO60DRAFT_1698379 [Scenedesmus sp. NREL 46B-D3]|nr:hypothetical protein COO60DRAFT_1698379 [Scenedesmus sp. NREL 46B-D3]